MSKKMYANFSDEAFNDLMSGAAVDNNGLRSPKGSFYPDQPSFEPINDIKEQLQEAGARILVAAGGYVVFKIVLPEVKRFTHEKVYPYAVEKWDNWQEKRRVKMAERQTSKKEYESSSDETVDTAEASNNCRVINFDDYRKMA